MPFVVLATVATGSVWAAVYLRRGSLIWALLLFLLVNSAFGTYFWQQSLGPVPLTLDRIAIVAVLVAYLVQRALGRTWPKPLGHADWLLGGFLAVLLLSTLTHDWKSTAADGIVPIWRLITGYVVPAVVYWVARQMQFEPRQSRQLMAALTVFGVYLSITALLEMSHQWSLVFPRTIADPQLGLHFGRARGPMLHSVGFGFYLGTCLVAAWIWLGQHGRRGAVALALVVPLMLTGAYLSYTRSVWLGVALAMAIVLGSTLRGAWRPLLLGSGLCAGLIVAVCCWDRIMAFQRDYSAEGTRESVHLRKNFAYVSWRMFLDHPLLGCGFGQFYVEKLPYLSDRSTELNLEAIRPLIHHNLPLALLTETGLIGLLLFLCLIYRWLADAWRLWRHTENPPWMRCQSLFFLGVLGLYIPQALFHEVSYLNMVHMLLFCLAGFSTGLCQSLQAGVPSIAAPTPYPAAVRPAC
jgi:O-antigen ligase